MQELERERESKLEAPKTAKDNSFRTQGANRAKSYKMFAYIQHCFEKDNLFNFTNMANVKLEFGK